MLAIEAGKAVLVEKPFTMNAADSRLLAEAARVRGTFLMEAMWTWFLPHIVAIRELIDAGRIGEIVTVTAEFGAKFGADSPRAFVLEEGGGALLDIGIYPVSFATMLLGQPQQIIAAAVESLPFDRTCKCGSALRHALITRPDAIPARLKQDLAPLIGKYVS